MIDERSPANQTTTRLSQISRPQFSEPLPYRQPSRAASTHRLAMATSVAPARAVPRNVAQLLSQKTPAGPKARASLIYDMHSKLYPHLYDGKIQPVHSTNEETGKVKRYLAKKTPQFDAPYYAEKAEWRKMYSDSKLEQASTYSLLSPSPMHQRSNWVIIMVKKRY
jgi:hypothetical protein